MDLEKKQFLNFPFEVKQINDEDPDFFIFEGYASTFGNVDLGDDVVVKGAFTKTLQENPNFKILWQHKMQEPIGMPTRAFEDEKGLFISAKLPREDSFVSGRVIPQIKVGSIDSMSIGFFVKDFDVDKGVRFLKEVELFETSLVTMPMNPKANLTDFKSDKEKEEIEDIAANQEEKLNEIKTTVFESVEDVQPEIKEVEKYLKFKGLSSKESKTIISRIKDVIKQRDVVDQDTARDEQFDSLTSEIKNLTNYLKNQ